MAGNGWECLKMAEDIWKLIEISKNGWNGYTYLEWLEKSKNNQ